MVDAEESKANRELSPGQILMQARTSAGLTHEQIANELYMTVSKVKALEADEYERLNSDTFVRGYIRAYANLLKLDVTEIITAYEQYLQKHKPEAAINHQVIAGVNPQRRAWKFLAGVVGFGLLLWLISVWFLDNHSENEYVVPTAKIQSVDKISAGNTADNASDVVVAQSSVLAKVAVAKSLESNANNVESDAAKVPVSSAANSISTVAGQVAMPTVNAPVASTAAINATSSTAKSDTAAKKNALDEIIFSFRAECWLEVSDSRGDVLATELEAAGSKVKLVGKAPFDVKLGNAPGADITLNGNKIEVIPLLGSNVLTLKVGN